MNISSEKTALEKAINSIGLPCPLPDRRQKPDENLIRNYLKNAKKIVEFPGMTQRNFINLSGRSESMLGQSIAIAGMLWRMLILQLLKEKCVHSLHFS